MSLADQVLQYLITGVSVGMVYALVGLGLTIIFNATGIISEEVIFNKESPIILYEKKAEVA